MLDISITNRIIDQRPIIKITANDPASIEFLNQIYQQIEDAQLKAIPSKQAGIHNACGGTWSKEGTISISVQLLLGGANITVDSV